MTGPFLVVAYWPDRTAWSVHDDFLSAGAAALDAFAGRVPDVRVVAANGVNVIVMTDDVLRWEQEAVDHVHAIGDNELSEMMTSLELRMIEIGVLRHG